jgi:hypothetical protein
VVNIPGIAVVPNGAREIPPVGVLKLYRAEGWWPERTAEQVRAVLRAAPAVGAWHGQDLIGLGRALLAGLMEQLKPVPVVTLFCSPDLVGHYEASSFRRTRQVVMHRS